MKKLLFTIGCLLVVQTMFGQRYSFEELVDFTLLDAGPITSKNEVQGYYLFFEKDKRDQDSTEFIIKILDQNLNELTNKEFTSAPSTGIEGLVFNGQSILLKKFVPEKKDLDYTVYSMQVNGQLDSIGSQRIRVDKYSTSAVHAVPGKGFVNIYTTDKRQAILEFYGNNGEKWVYNTPEEIKWEELSYVVNYENRLLMSSYRKNKVSDAGDYFMKAFDIESGEVIYEQRMTDFGYDHQITRGFVNEMQDEIWLTGDYFDRGDEESAENSNGLFLMKMSPDGEILNSDYAPWDGKISKYSKGYRKGKPKEGFLYTHDFVFLETGEVFSIAEQYRKAFRVLGVAEAALTFGAYGRLSKVFIGDLMILRFSQDAKLLEAKRNRKPQRTELPNKGFYGGIFIPGKRIGEVMADQHAYDFSHISIDNENTSFTVFYYTKEAMSKKQIKRSKRQPRYILRTITFKDREWIKEKFYLTDGKGESVVNILPAKPGYILISEVSEDYTGLRLEKINK